MTRILQVSNNHFVAGGSDRYYFELTKALRNSGCSVDEFAARDSRNEESEVAGFFPEAAVIEDARARDLPRYLYSRSARLSLCRLIRERPVDIAHLHIFYGRLTASILRPLVDSGIPIVQTLHEYKLICAVYTCQRSGQSCEACGGSKYWNAVRYRCNRGSLVRSLASSVESYVSKALGTHDAVDHYIAVSHFQRQRMLANKICAPDQISTIHNFVDPEALRPNSEAGRYALYFGRLEKLKGMDTLLAAAKRIPDVTLKIVGSGAYRLACEAHIRNDGLDNVELIDFLDGEQLFDTIRGSFCTVLPAEWYENCPMSVLESLALGKAVIGTDIGGIPELIIDGEDGFVVPVRDSAALANAIERLAGDAKLAKAMGEAGRAKIEQQFSPAAHVAQVRAVYEKVTDSAG